MKGVQLSFLQGLSRSCFRKSAVTAESFLKLKWSQDLTITRNISAQMQSGRKYVPRRACMYVPGDDNKKIGKIPSLGVDCAILDCEDGVAISKKKEARENIRRILDNKEINFGRTECAVRLNSIETKFISEDIGVILSAKNLPSSILLPKVDTIDHLKLFYDAAGKTVQANKNPSKLSLILFTESAKGLLDLKEIMQTAFDLSERTDNFFPEAVVFGSDDFCADIGATRSNGAAEVTYARQHILTVAKAFKIQAIDIVYIDYKDLEGLRKQCLEGAAWGFTGKQIIHPGQIPICQEAFSPSKAKVDWARELVSAFTEHQKSGKGAFNFKGSMIDMPLLLQAKNILETAERIPSLS